MKKIILYLLIIYPSFCNSQSLGGNWISTKVILPNIGDCTTGRDILSIINDEFRYIRAGKIDVTGKLFKETENSYYLLSSHSVDFFYILTYVDDTLLLDVFKLKEHRQKIIFVRTDPTERFDLKVKP